MHLRVTWGSPLKFQTRYKSGVFRLSTFRRVPLGSDHARRWSSQRLPISTRLNVRHAMKAKSTASTLLLTHFGIHVFYLPRNMYTYAVCMI